MRRSMQKNTLIISRMSFTLLLPNHEQWLVLTETQRTKDAVVSVDCDGYFKGIIIDITREEALQCVCVPSETKLYTCLACVSECLKILSFTLKISNVTFHISCIYKPAKININLFNYNFFY